MTKPGLLLFMTDIDAAHETEFHRWYEEEHIRERLAIPGFLTARRFQTLEGSPKYLAIYDLESPGVLHSPEYQLMIGTGKTLWTRRMEQLFVNARRNVYVGISERRR